MNLLRDRPTTLCLLTTGGTISTHSDGTVVGAVALDRSQLPTDVHYRIEEVCRVTSSRMDVGHWLLLHAAVQRSLSGVDGVVVTHGTDTLEESAFFLRCTLEAPCPIVLTGAMHYADERQSDGGHNLYDAVDLARCRDDLARGVRVVFCGSIYEGHDVWKWSNYHRDAFRARNGRLGVIRQGVVSWFSRQERSARALLGVPARPEDFPLVPIISDYTGFDGRLLESLHDLPVAGLVFQSFAGGRLSRQAAQHLGTLAREMPVVIASKVPTGRLMGDPNPGLPVAYASDLSAVQARILLMLGMVNDRVDMLFGRYSS